MNFAWTEAGWEDYVYWQGADKKIVARINDLIKNILRSPFSGIGKPEPLKFELTGKWSRRINEEHRLVYKVTVENKKMVIDKMVIIYQCRYHYD